MDTSMLIAACLSSQATAAAALTPSHLGCLQTLGSSVSSVISQAVPVGASGFSGRVACLTGMLSPPHLVFMFASSASEPEMSSYMVECPE